MTDSPVPDDHAYEFTNHWFAEPLKQIWAQIFSKFSPRNLLEIGSFEGASACHLVETLASRHPIRLTCIDTWDGGAEHRKGGPFEADMPAVEARGSERGSSCRARHPQRPLGRHALSIDCRRQGGEL